MTGNELIKALQELSEEELECPVYVYANHGQSQMQQNHVSIFYCTEYEYELDDCVVDEEELEDYLENGYEIKKFIEIA